MLLPVPMKKVVAVTHSSKKDEILRELKEAGVMEIRSSEENEVLEKLGLERGEGSWVRVEASENLSRIENIIEALREVRKGEHRIKSLGEYEELIREIPSRPEKLSRTFEEIAERLYYLEEKVSNLSTSLNDVRKELEEFRGHRKVLERLEKFNLGPKDLRGFKQTVALLGTLPKEEVPALEEDLKEKVSTYILERREEDKKRDIIILMAFAQEEAEVTRMLRLRQFEETTIPLKIVPYTLQEARSKVEENIEELKEEEGKILQELQEIASQEMDDLMRYKEFLNAARTIDEIHTKFSRTRDTLIFQGWVPSNKADDVKKLIQEHSDGHSIVDIQEPDEGDQPPTLLNNPRVTRPLEVLTNNYGFPSYNEVDPTLIIALTFPLIFGFMFGDIGHGFVVALLGALMAFKLDLGQEARKLGKTLVLCGSVAFVVGWLYGSLFGLEGEHMEHYLGFKLEPLWFTPMNDISSAVVFSLQLGAALITLSLLLNVLKMGLNKEYRHLFVHPFGVAGLWFFLGAVSLLSTYGLDFGMLLASASSLALIYLPLAIIVIGMWRVENLGLVMALFETVFEVILIYISNGLSFVRIMVIGIVHAGLASMMVGIMDMLSSPAFVGIVFVAGNILIIVFEMFISFIQDLRLHFYEIFSKFYSGEGVPFKPLKIAFESLEKG